MAWLFWLRRRPIEPTLHARDEESAQEHGDKADSQSEDEATSAYLGLALTEHLAMRAEMNEVIRHNFNLVLAALGIAAGTAALAAADTFAWKPDQRGFVLLVAAGFGFIVLLASTGIFNSYKILEWYVERTGADIGRIGKELRPDARLTSFQPAVRRFVVVDRRQPKRAVALMVSYGMMGLLGFVVIILLVAMVFSGFQIGTTVSSGGLSDWILPVTIGDAVLGALATGALFLSFHIQNDWATILDPDGGGDQRPTGAPGHTGSDLPGRPRG